MGVIGGGSGGFAWWGFDHRRRRGPHPRRPSRSPSSSSHVDAGGGAGGKGFQFPVKPAATAASLALAGDAIAQVKDQIRARDSSHSKDIISSTLESYDWLRALRMTSYGFLLYGPGSYAWYRFLDQTLPQPSIFNFSLKVVLNQIVLGPSVIAVVFAWNNLWKRKLSELPEKYRRDALPTLLYGFRFWIPVSVLNFGVVPLQARVAFMSTCAIFWNFYLSSTVSK